MGGRITQRLLVNNVLTNINRQSREILKLQEQLSTLRRVNRPSDAPLAVRRAVNAQTQIAKNEQYLANITAAQPQLTDTESVMRSAVDLIQRANELTLQANNGVNGQAQRDQIANEINQILEEMLAQGNRVTNGRYIFGGTRTQSPPMQATRGANNEVTAVAYIGNGVRTSIEISDGLTINVNQPGDEVFFTTTPGTVNIFETLITIRDGLRTANTAAVNTGLANLESAQEQVLVVLSKSGAVQNRMDRTRDNLEDINVQLASVVSENIDVDFAEVALNLNAQSNAFQAALDAGARVIQPSLLDFVR
jgi:flagellar hook-associated protein 3 FlgL